MKSTRLNRCGPNWRESKYYLRQAKAEKRLEKEKDETDIYTVFEQEFADRCLQWSARHWHCGWMMTDTSRQSLKRSQAVISGKLSFRYIDRILIEWKKNGVKTVEQAENYGKRFRQYQTKSNRHTNEKTDRIPKDLLHYNYWSGQ